MDNILELPWDDGSGDKIYLDFSKTQTQGIIEFSSDYNWTEVDRTKVLKLNGASKTYAQAAVYLQFYQKPNHLVIASFDQSISIYDEVKAGYINQVTDPE